jgi:hypothetical protein
MMTKTSRRLSIFVVLFLATAGFVPVAQALPRSAIHIEYYDCNFQQVGEWDKNCNGIVSYWGAQSGTYQHFWTEPCGPFAEPEDNWYEWNGSYYGPLSNGVPPGCEQDETIDYYSCDQAYAGTVYTSCSGQVSSSGTAGGYYRHIVKRFCSSNAVSFDHWYYYSCGNWYQMSGPPDPHIMVC